MSARPRYGGWRATKIPLLKRLFLVPTLSFAACLAVAAAIARSAPVASLFLCLLSPIVVYLVTLWVADRRSKDFKTQFAQSDANEDEIQVYGTLVLHHGDLAYAVDEGLLVITQSQYLFDGQHCSFSGDLSNKPEQFASMVRIRFGDTGQNVRLYSLQLAVPGSISKAKRFFATIPSRRENPASEVRPPFMFTRLVWISAIFNTLSGTLYWIWFIPLIRTLLVFLDQAKKNSPIQPADLGRIALVIGACALVINLHRILKFRRALRLIVQPEVAQTDQAFQLQQEPEEVVRA